MSLLLLLLLPLGVIASTFALNVWLDRKERRHVRRRFNAAAAAKSPGLQTWATAQMR